MQPTILFFTFFTKCLSVSWLSREIKCIDGNLRQQRMQLQSESLKTLSACCIYHNVYINLIAIECCLYGSPRDSAELVRFARNFAAIPTDDW